MTFGPLKATARLRWLPSDNEFDTPGMERVSGIDGHHHHVALKCTPLAICDSHGHA